MYKRLRSQPRRRLLYFATGASLIAFTVGSTLKDRNCPEGWNRVDSGVTCDYTVLEAAILTITLLTVVSTVVVLCTRLTTRLRTSILTWRKRNRDAVNSH